MTASRMKAAIDLQALAKASTLKSATPGMEALAGTIRLYDIILGDIVFLAAFVLYLRTLAPSVVAMFDDTLELQLVTYQLGIAHPTGYPLFTLLGKLFTLLPFGDPAYRVNLMTAFWGAIAISLLYVVGRRACEAAFGPLTGTAGKLAPFAVAAVALSFAASPDFWSSANNTEVYTLNLFFIGLTLALALRCGERGVSSRDGVVLAFVYSLSLTHHRTMLLLAPAIAVYVILSRFAGPLRKKPISLNDILKPAIMLVLPLVLYLYLPIRGASVTSLDGTYENTLGGFIKWVTASGYGVFFLSNPWGFKENPALDYGHVLLIQFSWLGVILGVIGLIRLLGNLRVWLLFALGLAATVIFALTYRVNDPEPFYLPSFYIFAVLVAIGAVAVLEIVAKGLRALRPKKVEGDLGGKPAQVPPGTQLLQTSSSVSTASSRRGLLKAAMTVLVAVAFFAAPANQVAANYSSLDLSREDTVLSYGLDILSQPIEPDSAIVGIGGEMTLLKYLQATRSLRPDLAFIAADDETKRLNEITTRLSKGQNVYTTRPLAGLAERYSLKSVGPLIEVLSQPSKTTPTIANLLSARFGNSIELIGCNIDQTTDGQMVVARGSEPGKAKPTVRFVLFWRVLDKVPSNYSVFIHVESADGRLAGQKDGQPVNGAYPTSQWRPGEIIVDTYDVPLPIGTHPDSYDIRIGLYDSNGNRLTTTPDKSEADIGKLLLDHTVSAPPSGKLDVESKEALLGDNLKLLGYKLSPRSARPGDTLELDLLWQAIGPISENKSIRLWLTGAKGEHLAEYISKPNVGLHSMARWEKDEAVRDVRYLTIPADAVDGFYKIEVGLAPDGKMIPLTSVEVKGRKRVFEAPAIANPLNFSSVEGVTLLGYNLKEGSDPAAMTPGSKLGLTLYWQGSGKFTTNYTVFVHLVGDDGRPIAQGDGLPQGGAAPMTGWVQGEVVADEHELIIPQGIPPGDYRILVGMYDPLTGRRVETTTGDSVTLGTWTVK